MQYMRGLGSIATPLGALKPQAKCRLANTIDLFDRYGLALSSESKWD